MKKRMISAFLLLMSSALLLTGFGRETYIEKTTLTVDAKEISAVDLENEPIPMVDMPTSLPETDVPEPASSAVTDFGQGISVVAGIEETMLCFGSYVYDLSEEELTELQERVARENEYAKLALCKVPGYVNIRSIPSTDGEILGKIYQGSVAEILEVAGENQDWFKITSGSVEGYIKSDFFLSGQDAVASIDEYVKRYAQVQVTMLNVRREATTDSECLGYLELNEKAPIYEVGEEWVRIKYNDKQQGYVAAKYVVIVEEFSYAISIEEEQAELRRVQELEARKKAAEQAAREAEAAKQKAAEPIVVNTQYETVDELREAIVTFALQYVGGPYKSGGNSLTNGTDCSGFTSLIYAQFGYSLSRTPGGQYSGNGRSIDLANAKRGDIICYGSGTNCTHVAIYLGDNQIVHAANKRRGICVSSVNMEPIIGIKSIVE